MVTFAYVSPQKAGLFAAGGRTAWPLGRSWKLSDLKGFHPIQVAEFAIQMGVALKPGFNWWVFWVLKKKGVIILLVKICNVKYLNKTHKFGFPLPKSVEDALDIDCMTDSILWADVIAKEMMNINVAFDAQEVGRKVRMDSSFSNATWFLTSR